MSKEFCNGCAQNITLVNCSEILENCSLRQQCNSYGDLFGESSDRRTTNVVLLVSAVILFIFLLLKDGLKGLKIRAHWIPGDFLVLSALTIELLNLISTQGEPLNWEKRFISLNEFWMIHTSRIMLCVVIAYLMPAMANPGAEDFWGKIVSLALTVFLHVISELYFINPKSASSILKALWPRQQGTSLHLYYILAGLIFSSFCLLLFLLACANIAGRGIERIIAKKVPLILKGQAEEDDQHRQHHSHEGVWRAEEDHHRCQERWQRVEDELLTAWIVARAYSLEYVIARSALASSSAIIVTFQIAITIIAGVRNSPKLALCDARDKLRFAETMLQCVFILIGWSMILWRWITAVAYYGSRRSCFRIEDFWTRHLRESQQAQKYELPLSQLLQAKIEKLVVNQSTKITVPRYLLYPVIWLQLFIVSFSKACLFVSPIPFCNKSKDELMDSKLSELPNKYRKILEDVRMLGENPAGLWLSNRQSIEKAADLISRGKRCKCQELVDFLAGKRTCSPLGLSCLRQTGLKYLCKRPPIEGTQQPPEEFTGIGRKPYKMTAVSLLSVIAQLSLNCVQSDKVRASTSGSLPPSVVKDCFKAYSQAWEIIDFVDKADTEADDITSEETQEITSEAADMYFATLREKVSEFREATVPQKVTAALAPLRTESKRKTETPASIKPDGLKGKDKTQGCPQRWNGSDSMDWKAEAVGSAVYKLCNNIQCNEETDANDLLKELESSLAAIINECLEKIQDLLILNCRKWAIKGDERKIAKALYTAGKASKIIEILKNKEGSGSAVVQHLG